MDNTTPVVLVTGATRGIGLAIAERLADRGMHVVVNSHSELSDEQKTAIAGDHEFTFVIGDVSDENAAQQMVTDVVDQFGHIDGLINNAGITRDKLLSRMKLADFEAVINTNLVGAFNMTKAALKVMQKQRSGSIVNLSSIAGTNGNMGQANYSASKAGLIGLTKTSAREGALRGIRCNAIAPGMIKTDMTDKLSDKMKDQFTETIPLKRFGEPDEIAQTAEFLLTNQYITGQVIKVDGGLMI